MATKKYVDDQTTSIPANALLTTPRINDTSSDHKYKFAASELSGDRTVTLPLLTGDDEFVFKDHTQTLTNKTLTNPDINGGTIDSATIATSDITVGAGKTLNVSAGTLTLADNQISGDKVEGGTIAGITITTLGSTTVNSTTVDTTNVEVTNIKAKDGTSAATIADSTGVVTIPSSVLTTTDINGGTIDNATIGATTPAAITGTTITANTNFVGNVTGNVTGTVSSIANHSTSDLSEGTNLYHTTERARASVSVTDSGGDGSLAYNSTSGVITYTGPSAAETRAHFSAGTGVGISGGEISIGQAVGTTDNVTFGNIAGTLTTAAQGNITSVGTLTGLNVSGDATFDTNTLFVDASENRVGIGTTTPSLKLDITDSNHCMVGVHTSDSGKQAQVRFSSDNGSSNDVLLIVGAGSVGGRRACYINSRYDYPISFSQNNVEVMTISDNGNVGFGTISPQAKLSIDSGKIYFQGDDDYSSYGISFYHGGSSLEKKILYYSGTTDKRTVIRGVNDGTISSSSTGGILFKNEADTDLMLLSSNGDVGIGTTSPSYKLDVSGTGRFTGNLTATLIGNVTGNVTGTVSSIANHDTSDLSEGTNLYHTTERARASVSVTDSGGDGSLAYNSTSGVITYTGPSAAETRAHFSAGTGVGISAGEISIGQAVGTTDNVTSVI